MCAQDGEPCSVYLCACVQLGEGGGGGCGTQDSRLSACATFVRPHCSGSSELKR